MLNDRDLLESLPLDQLERVDAACDLFTASWKLGERPRLEDAIQEAPESLRPLIAAELLRTEIELRVATGNLPKASEYASRFPEWSDELEQLVDDLAGEAYGEMASTVEFATETAEEMRSSPQVISGSDRTKSVADLDELTANALKHRFAICETLGRGGMGIVVKARDTKLDREVALKVLVPELARDVSARQRFLREARAAAAVRHENVVTVYSADEINEVPLLEMELINGESLAQRIRREGALPADEVLALTIQIARGLDAAHRRGLIHRDIKPANILLETIEGEKPISSDSQRFSSTKTDPRFNLGHVRVKITDFGLARVTAEATLTHSGVISGTPQYMSPEQAEGQVLDHRSDLFSLGSVMYAMSTGRAAFHAENVIAVVRLVVDSTPTAISTVNPNVPAALVAIVEKLMAKRPDDRFQSAGEVIDALTQVQIQVDHPDVKQSPATAKAWKPARWASLIAATLALSVAFLFSNRQAGQDLDNKGQSIPVSSSPPPFVATQTSERIAPKSPQNSAPPSMPHPLVSEGYQWTIPENLGPGINSPRFEDHACISADGLEMLLARVEDGKSDIWFSRRSATTEPFGTAELLPKEINSPARESDPFLSYDGLSLWFTSDRTREHEDTDIYVSRRANKSAPFESPERLGPTVNTSQGESSPFVTDDELTLLFGRGTPRQIYQATRPNRDAPFGRPKRLANINTGTWQEFPRLTRDGLNLILVASLADGQQYLWSSSRLSIDADFGPLVSLGPTINRGMMSGPSLSADERTLYFSALRPSGYGKRDLWVSRRIHKPAPIAPTREPKSNPVGTDLPPYANAPFDAETARKHQEAWAMHLGTQVEIENSIGMKLTLIPPGEFLMGAALADADALSQERPQHRVRLTKPYLIGTTEVTIAQFGSFVKATQYVTQAESDKKGAVDVRSKSRQPELLWNNLGDSIECPVRCVSWEDARRFCEWLSASEGRAYRLPTDAEWEFACRAGTQTRYSFGDDFNETKANCLRASRNIKVLPAGEYAANPFGLFDMHGNVNEICWDTGRAFTEEAVVDPIGSIDLNLPAVVRGGAISSSTARLRSSQRYLSDARNSPGDNFATPVKGFRVVALIDSHESK